MQLITSYVQVLEMFKGCVIGELVKLASTLHGLSWGELRLLLVTDLEALRQSFRLSLLGLLVLMESAVELLPHVDSFGVS